MGRTNPTFRDYLRQFEAEWQPYRRALRAQYRADFDRLLERAAQHAAAAGYVNATEPRDALWFTILLTHEIELRELCEADPDGSKQL